MNIKQWTINLWNRLYPNGQSRKKKIGKAVLIAGLLLFMWVICSRFMEIQRNQTNQVNKYRIDQVCLLNDSTVVEQVFKAKHTHLKTLKLYFSNDYGGQAEGQITVQLIQEDTGEVVSSMDRQVKELLNNEYTEFDTDVQLKQGTDYIIRISAEGTESGKEPIVYQWSTKEKGFHGHMTVNGEKQKHYLVAKFYCPVTIYFSWIYIVLIFAAVIFLILVPLPGLLPERVQNVIGLLMFWLAPLFTFWFVERFTDNSVFRINPQLILMNVIVYYMFYGLLYLLCVSRRLTVILGMVIWYLIGVANYFVLAFKGAPIVPSDMMSAATGFSVAGNYTYTIQPVFVWNLLFILLYGVLFFRFCITKKTGWKLRIVMALLIALCAGVLGHFIVEQKTFKSWGIKNNVWDQKKGYAKNGLFFGFVLNLNSLVQEKPSDYSAEAAEDIAGKYAEQFANEKKSEKRKRLETKDGTKPNIIGIMNEALADLSVVGDFETSQDYMPYIHSLKKNTIKGNLYMSIFGSGTCNSEFECLTGNSVSFLQSGIITFTQVIKGRIPNITYGLKSNGYGGNLALHPYLSTGWNRESVYEWMGFEHFYSEADFENPLLYRKYISDQSDFEKIEELYENREEKDKPFYLWNVTMQNHGGFDKIYDNFTNDVLITDNHKNEQAEQYLSLVKKSDEAFRQLTEYFSKVDEPTIIFMYGDHQPAVESTFYDSLLGEGSSQEGEDVLKKYQTPFIIWANYDIKETTIEKMSANYLGAYIMEQAGLKTTDYQKFLLKLRKNLPVITAMGAIDKDGNYYSSALDSPYSDMVKEYQILQYNNLIDTKHTVTEFFYPEEK